MEGHNRETQALLHEQPGAKTFNLIQEAVNFVNKEAASGDELRDRKLAGALNWVVKLAQPEMLPPLTCADVKILSAAIALLVEAMQGPCSINQELIALGQNNVLDALKRIITESFKCKHGSEGEKVVGTLKMRSM